MKTIICDECVPKRLMYKLSDSGFDVIRPPHSEPDTEIMAYATHHNLPIITYDHDFKEYPKSIILDERCSDKSCSKFIKKSIKKFEKF